MLIVHKGVAYMYIDGVYGCCIHAFLGVYMGAIYMYIDCVILIVYMGVIYMHIDGVYG
jgi:hypothetical protein